MTGRATDSSGPETTLALVGDVMTGRGIDQILPRSVDPTLHERYVDDARVYVRLAEEADGSIPPEVGAAYPWGDALAELERAEPHLRVVNLETAVTESDEWWREKGIHYRMHPGNVDVLTAAGIDVCVLGNNHVLDWGRPGLSETLSALHGAGLSTAGAGEDRDRAAAPAVHAVPGGRVLIFAYGSPTAGVPLAWAATAERSGVNVLDELGSAGADRVATEVSRWREPGDRVVVSIHWGGNWGYDVPAEERRFAHGVIESGAADVVFGHSSHHPKGVEIHRERLVLYGAGDFLNDYEGIGGRERYRSELVVLHLPVLAPDGALAELTMVPFRVRRFRLRRATGEEAAWLARTLERESEGVGMDVTDDARIRLVPSA